MPSAEQESASHEVGEFGDDIEDIAGYDEARPDEGEESLEVGELVMVHTELDEDDDLTILSISLAQQPEDAPVLVKKEPEEEDESDAWFFDVVGSPPPTAASQDPIDVLVEEVLAYSMKTVDMEQVQKGPELGSSPAHDVEMTSFEIESFLHDAGVMQQEMVKTLEAYAREREAVVKEKAKDKAVVEKPDAKEPVTQGVVESEVRVRQEGGVTAEAEHPSQASASSWEPQVITIRARQRQVCSTQTVNTFAQPPDTW